MPANVTNDFVHAQEKYENAKTLVEKLAALEGMKSLAPKHKGGENLRAEINRKISLIRNEMEKEKKQASKRGGGQTLAVKKEGAGQIVLVGLPSSGKTTFFNEMTGLHMPVGSYGFTTAKPDMGMVDFKGAKIQLVDLPPIVEGSAEGKVNGKEILAIIRNADAIALILDGRSAQSDYETVSNELKKAGILLNKKKPLARISPSSFPGISITGKQHLKIPHAQLIHFLKNMGMFNVQVILGEPTTLDTIAESLNEKLVYKKALVVYMKQKPDQKINAGENVPNLVWDELKNEKSNIADRLFEILDKVYVYTKKPGDPPAMHLPLIVNKNATVLDVATAVHKDIVQNLQYAKVWGSTKFDGQRVSKDYKVQNGDIVEFYW